MLEEAISAVFIKREGERFSTPQSAAPIVDEQASEEEKEFEEAWEELHIWLATSAASSQAEKTQVLIQNVRTHAHLLYTAGRHLIQLKSSQKTGRTLLDAKRALETAEKEFSAHIDLAIAAKLNELQIGRELAKQDARWTLWTNIVLLLVAIGTAVTLSFILSTVVVNPLLKMRETAIEIGQGNLDNRVQIKSRDEIKELADAFNGMVIDLGQSHIVLQHANDELEQRVQKRTAELANTNDSRRQSEERLRSVITGAPVVVWALGIDGRFTLSEGRALESVGLTPGEPVGQSIFDVYKDAPAVIEHAQRTFAGEASAALVEIGAVAFDMHSAPVRDDAGHGTRIIGVARDVTERQRAEKEREELHHQLVEVSRQAGMAEVASHVLHNVGNVLNSVNVSASLLGRTVRESPSSDVSRISTLLDQHSKDLGEYLTSNPQGQQIPGYLTQLGEHITQGHRTMLAELDTLNSNIDHIKEIIGQQ